MEQQTQSTLIGVIAALIVGLPAIITAIAGLLVSIRNGKDIGQVHQIVNSQRVAMEAKIAALEKELRERKP